MNKFYDSTFFILILSSLRILCFVAFLFLVGPLVIMFISKLADWIQLGYSSYIDFIGYCDVIDCHTQD